MSKTFFDQNKLNDVLERAIRYRVSAKGTPLDSVRPIYSQLRFETPLNKRNILPPKIQRFTEFSQNITFCVVSYRGYVWLSEARTLYLGIGTMQLLSNGS